MALGSTDRGQPQLEARSVVYYRTMFSPLRAFKIYKDAAADLGDLIHAWTSYRRMTRDERTVAVLARANPLLFGTVTAALRAYSGVLISKLLERGVGEGSASLEALFSQADLDVSVRSDLMSRLNSIATNAEEVIEHGHRRRIHTGTPIDVEDTDVREPSQRQFEVAIAGLRALMERFEDVAGLERRPYENCDGTRDVGRILEQIEAGAKSA